MELDKVNHFRNFFQILHFHLQDAVMKKENMVKIQTKLEKIAHFFKSTIQALPGIVIRKLALAEYNKILKQKTFLFYLCAAAVVPS